jgi:glycerol uptake facilitator-like aquaporin
VTVARTLAAEGLGTAILVATVVGSGIMAQRLTADVALQLLCNSAATGAILVVLISLFAPVSGAHFNPAVTAVLALRGELSPRLVATYIAVQVAGALAGAVLAHLMFDLPVVSQFGGERTGASQWLAEAVATFGLVCVVLAGARVRAETLPWLVGLYITAAYWFTASTSFANPAVTLARALTESFAGIRPVDVPGFIAAQLVGAAVALAFVRWLLEPSRR